MAVNSSSLSLSYFYRCSDFTVGVSISFAFMITHVFLLLPLSLFVLYLGHQRWRQQRSFATTSHSDIFTCHSAAVELTLILATLCFVCGEYTRLSGFMTVGSCVTSAYFPGQMSFHVLTCVERYLAVVHPVIYLQLRQSGGVRIRNISISCAWLQYCGWIGVIALYSPNIPYMLFFCSLILCLVVVSFCSLSVLCVLIRPGPGEMAGGRERVDQSKQRAFNTITAITGVLWLYFIVFLVCLALESSHLLSYNYGCIVLTSGNWFNLPSSLVLPLLFLHKAGKLFCCHCSNEQRPPLH